MAARRKLRTGEPKRQQKASRLRASLKLVSRGRAFDVRVVDARTGRMVDGVTRLEIEPVTGETRLVTAKITAYVQCDVLLKRVSVMKERLGK